MVKTKLDYEQELKDKVVKKLTDKYKDDSEGFKKWLFELLSHKSTKELEELLKK